MEKRTSSVDWLVDKLTPANWTKEQMQKHFSEVIQQAKEMHENQIKEAYIQGYKQAMTNQTAQQYYNETYGSAKQD